jgi:formylglycine-generating enzyme required for sulfatase activity
MVFEAFLAQLLASSGVAPPPPRVPAPAFSCPSDMVPVEGVHRDQVDRLCLDFRGQHCFAFWPEFVAYEGTATPIRACMDRYEWPNTKGALPVVMESYVEAQRSCASVGKRLCTEYEWETACEGPDARPWPYGYRFEKGVCNTDKTYRPVSEAKLASKNVAVRERETQRAWQGEPVGTHPACVSPFGVEDMTGNVEEWVHTSRPEWQYESSLKGGYWSKPWAGCRGTNDSHGPQFRFYEVGFRCCKDPG